MTSNSVPVIESGHRCENGAARERNEDACLTLTAEFGGHFGLRPMGLFIVADGMGGRREGHIASNAATRAFAEFVLSQLYFPLLRGRPEPKEADLLDVMERGVFAAHDAVFRPEPDSSGGGNGGTTLTAALILGRRLAIAHVGDSRAYLLGGDELRPLTEDHSLVRRLQETGRLSPEDAQSFQYRNVLLQALGQEGALTADTYSVDLPARGVLLLCSDGLCGQVPQEEMAVVLHGHDTAQTMADRLYEAAMAAGGHDNITAVVVRFA
jgi:PPM family protein phosphatase